MYEDIVNSQEIILDDDEVVIERDLSNKEPVQDTEVNDKHIVGEDSQEITIEEDADDNGTKVAEEKPSDKTENEVVEEKKVSDVELIKDAENNTHPATTMKYTCKTWRKDFDKRPDMFMPASLSTCAISLETYQSWWRTSITVLMKNVPTALPRGMLSWLISPSNILQL